MTQQRIKPAYAKFDPAHVFDGLFVPTKGKKRGRLTGGGNSSLAQFEAATISTHLAGLPVQHSSVRYAIAWPATSMTYAALCKS